MRKHTLYYYGLAVVLLCITACGGDDAPELPTGDYANGVFVVNEGNFGGGNASITHFNAATSTVTPEVYALINGVPLGDVAQSMHIADDKAYIVVNNSAKVEIVNYGTFTSAGVITDGLANPRYVAVHGERAFISNWGNFDSNFQLDQSFIAVVDLTDNTLETSINTDDGSEQILIFEDKLYLSNSFTNNVQVFDVNTYELLGSTAVGQGPGQITLDANDNLWVISQGRFGGNDGTLTCIRTSDYSIERQLNFRYNAASRLVANHSDNLLYYYSGNTIWQFSPQAAGPEVLAEMSDFVGIYGIGYSPEERLIYVSDGVGFAGQGNVVRLATDGTRVDEFTAGIGPNSFVFTP